MNVRIPLQSKGQNPTPPQQTIIVQQGGGGASGSIDLNMPVDFSVLGAPASLGGSFLVSWNTQTASLVFRSGDSGGVPGFSSLTALDLAASPSSGNVLTYSGGVMTWAAPATSGTVTSITAGTGLSGGTITGSGTISLTTPVSVTNGGTGANLSATGGASQVLKQTTLGGAVTVGQLAASDLSNGTTGSGSVVLATSPTLVTPLLGTPTSGTLTNCTGLPIVAGTTGTLTETRGGTNQTTYALGDMLYGSAANTLSKANIGANQVPFMNASQVLGGDAGILYKGQAASTQLLTLTPTNTGANAVLISLPASYSAIAHLVNDSAGNYMAAWSFSTSAATHVLSTPSAGSAGSSAVSQFTGLVYPYQTSGNSLFTLNAGTRQGTGTNAASGQIAFNAAENQASGKVSADIVLSTCAVGAAVLTARWKFTANGNALLNATGSALATSATSGMTFIPTCAGAPTGNADKYTGAIGMLYDTTNNKLWVNTSGTTWKGVVLA